MSSYPKEAWNNLSPEDKKFMRELKSEFPNVKYLGELAPEGVEPFKVKPWKRNEQS